MDLSKVSTSELVRELSRREGVERTSVEPYEAYRVVAGDRKLSGTGPAVILVITD